MSHAKPTGLARKRRDKVHAQGRPQEQHLAAPLVLDRPGPCHEISQHGIADKPVIIGEKDVGLAAEKAQDECRDRAGTGDGNVDALIVPGGVQASSERQRRRQHRGRAPSDDRARHVGCQERQARRGDEAGENE